MTLYKHELKQGLKTFLIWTISIAGFMAMCVFLYPEMKDQVDSVGDMFSQMGAFSTAFGMDKLNFGTFTGFYAVECGNILSVGGAFFAAVISVNMLSKEEKEHTAEFLFSHPQSRTEVFTSKLCALITEIILMNIFVFIVTLISVKCIGESVEIKEIAMMHFAYFICQIELCFICHPISAFTRTNNYGIGLGMTMVLYFMSLLANISDKMKAFHIVSPFGYAEASDILTTGGLEINLMLLGMIIGVFCLAGGCVRYSKKDIY